ncbi:hypothetical protein GCM10017044_06240 [Kordiimonas sediminis]|uniref:DUF1674 domain-containing protein n=1 Tax=Kordiimonas sediminis TaxID=1735581 RepID=A0A919E5N2_9PROT|nr:succinate dehydrogenase assembly factor 4 [Kordiimonas sediminis]GHF14872.1 hypothetical protein GCM10017044_06240 [Kordiimonas sediminis]
MTDKATVTPSDKDDADIASSDTGVNADPKQDTTSGTQPREVGGQKGPEPTRYGDWEKNGIISDF